MKNSLVIFLIGVFVALVFLYALNNLSPWDLDQIKQVAGIYGVRDDAGFIESFNKFLNAGLIFRMLNYRNVVILGGLVSSSFVLLFASVHLTIDKLFFKKFYEEPKIFPAFRRGILIVLVCAGLVFLRLIGGFIWYNVVAVVGLIVAIELLAQSIRR